EELFDKIERETDPEKLRELTDSVTIELIRHAVAEEQYLYPATREYLPDGDELADKEIEDHNEVEEALKSLEQMDTADPDFMPTFRRMANEVRQHLKEEEEELFPTLRQQATVDALRELGAKVERA